VSEYFRVRVSVSFRRCAVCQYHSADVPCVSVIPPMCRVSVSFRRCAVCQYHSADVPCVSVIPPTLRGGADKSLARPTSRYRRTESIVSLKEMSVHVPNFKSFLDTEAERKHVRRRARFQQHRNASCHQVFFSCTVPKEINAILREP
jgi:C4-type Zn-finger protein